MLPDYISQMIESPKGHSLFDLQKGNANDLDTEISFYHNSPKNRLSDYANNLKSCRTQSLSFIVLIFL